MIEINAEIRKSVRDFVDSPAGNWYIERLDSSIKHNHNKAEDNPEMSRDYTQRAKGVREALEQLTSGAIVKESK